MVDKLSEDFLSKIPWPLTQQYELVHYWLYERKQPVYASLQLRDVWETFIKLLTTLVVAEDVKIVQNDGTLTENSPIFYLVTIRNLSIGTWVGILDEYRKVSQDKSYSNIILRNFVDVIQGKSQFTGYLGNFVTWRNERFGHGIFSQEIEVYQNETIEYLHKLEECFQTLVPFFEKIEIFSELPDQSSKKWIQSNFPLSLEKVVYPFHSHIANDTPDIWPVYAKIKEQNLLLSPILSIQKCEMCEDYSAFFLHGYDPEKKSKPVTFLEFLVKGGLKKKQNPFLTKLKNTAPAQSKEEKKETSPLENIEDDYDKFVRVDYLADKIEHFIETHNRGIINLVGIGGVGKSWFCKKLGESINLDCIYVRLQYSSYVNITGLLEIIGKFCKKKKWKFLKDMIDLREYKSFIINLLKKIKEDCPREKLILILDGWDELAEDCELFNYLTCSAKNLPKDCFVLIANRPNLKAKAEILLKDMLNDQENSIQLEMKPDEMAGVIQKYIRKKRFPEEWAQEIIKKSENIFLYVYHYCYLLGLKLFDSKNLPDKKNIYTFFFNHLKERVGEEFFKTCYVPLLSLLAVAKDSISLEQLTDWGIREDYASIALQDIAHLLERDTSGQEICYSLRHQDIKEFFHEDESWRKQCQEQEESILVWCKGKGESFLQTEEKELSIQEEYLIRYSCSHWDTMAERNLVTTDNIFPLEKLEQMILKLVDKLEMDAYDIWNIYFYLACCHGRKQQYEKAIEYYEKAIAIRLSKLGTDHPLVANSYGNLASVYRSQGQYDKAIEYHEKALAIRLPKLSANHTLVATSYNNLALVYRHQGQYDKAIEYYEKALTISLPKLGADHPNVAISYNNLASVYCSQCQYEKAIEYYGKALAIQLSKLGADHSIVSQSYNNLAMVYHGQGQYTKAIEYLEKALAIQLSKLGANHTLVATSYNNLAVVYHNQGQYGKAIEYHEKALDIQLSKLGADHPDIAISYNNLAGVYHGQGQYEKAIEYYEKALAIQLPKLGTDHPDVATSYGNLALIYDAQGQYEKAIEYHEKAFAIDLPKLGADHPNVATSYSNLARVYHSQGQYEKAIEYYEKALDIFLPKLGVKHPHVATSYGNLARVYYDQDQYEKAIEYYEKTLTILLPKLGADPPHVANSYGDLGMAYMADKRYGKANSFFQKALDILLPKLGPNHPAVKGLKEKLKECRKKLH